MLDEHLARQPSVLVATPNIVPRNTFAAPCR
jgi:hypothetical protein